MQNNIHYLNIFVKKSSEKLNKIHFILKMFSLYLNCNEKHINKKLRQKSFIYVMWNNQIVL